MPSTSWAEFDVNPTAPLLAQVVKISLGGTHGQKKPSSILVVPVADDVVLRYVRWDRDDIDRIGIIEGRVYEFTGFHRVPAYQEIHHFLPNYSSTSELAGDAHAKSYDDIVPVITKALLHEVCTSVLFLIQNLIFLTPGCWDCSRHWRCPRCQ